MHDDVEAGRSRPDRTELEIELARFALALARRADDPDRALAAEHARDAAAALVAAAPPEHRAWAQARVRDIARSLAGIDLAAPAPPHGAAFTGPVDTTDRWRTIGAPERRHS